MRVIHDNSDWQDFVDIIEGFVIDEQFSGLLFIQHQKMALRYTFGKPEFEDFVYNINISIEQNFHNFKDQAYTEE